MLTTDEGGLPWKNPMIVLFYQIYLGGTDLCAEMINDLGKIIKKSARYSPVMEQPGFFIGHDRFNRII